MSYLRNSRVALSNLGVKGHKLIYMVYTLYYCHMKQTHVFKTLERVSPTQFEPQTFK